MAALDDLHVVEISTGIAAAYCGKLLADAGAQVHVLEPAGGHPLRRRRPAPPPARAGLLFDFLMEAKKVTVLAGGDETPTAGAFIEEADLVIRDAGSRWSGTGVSGSEPPRPGTRGDHGASRPMVVSITPFGEEGPWVARPYSEITVQALAGSLFKRGLPGREPLQAGGAITEWVAGAYAAAGAASWWWGAGRGAAGVRLDVCSLEAAVLSLHSFMTIDAAFREGRGVVRRGPSIPSIEPTADGYVGFSTITATQFHDFLLMIERPDLADDPDLRPPERRQQRRAELDEAICSWTTVRTTDEIVAEATARRIPVAPIGNGENLPSMDHMAARRVFQPGEGGVLRPRVPYQVRPGAEASPDARPAPVRPAPARPATLPLEGLKVADFTAFWAGPAATHLLACLGADVVKIESVQRPDGMRLASARTDKERWWEWSAVFHGVNANKRSVTLHLGDERGTGLARRLIAWADVVIENFSPRVMEHFGFTWEAVSAVNPRAVMVRMPAFGLNGPWRDRTGFAMTVEQVSGLAWQTGYPDGAPMDVGGVCDPLGGMHAVVALMAALSRRESTGCGSLVELPLVEVALNVAAEHVLQHSAAGVLLGRLGNRDPASAPQGIFRGAAKDTWIALSVGDDDQWRSLAALLPDEGRPGTWLDDDSLATAEGRRDANDRLDRVLAGWCRESDVTDLAERLVAAGVPAAALIPPALVPDNPHLKARGFFEPIDHPVVGSYHLPSLPFRVVGAERRWNRTPPPTLGEHNAEVLRGILGVDDETLEDLRRDRVIGDRF